MKKQYVSTRHLLVLAAFLVASAVHLATTWADARPALDAAREQPEQDKTSHEIKTLEPQNETQPIAVQAYTLRRRLDIAAADGFATITPEQRARLQRLQLASTLISTVYVTADALLIVPGPGQPSSGLESLMLTDQDRLIVTADGVHYRATPAYLLDLLDRTSPSRRDVDPGTFEATPPTSSPNRAPLALQAATYETRIAYRSTNRSEPMWPLALSFTVTAVPAIAHSTPAAELLYAAALPQLLTRQRKLTLDGIAERIGQPLRWSVTVSNQRFPTTGPICFTTEVEDLGPVPLQNDRLVAPRGRLRRAEYLPLPTMPGVQLVEAAELQGLRDGKPDGTLRVRNKGSHSALIYVDGVLVGWIAPHEAMTFKGLPRGFYRLRAVTPSGIRAWGPEDTYLPGTFTLH